MQCSRGRVPTQALSSNQRSLHILRSGDHTSKACRFHGAGRDSGIEANGQMMFYLCIRPLGLWHELTTAPVKTPDTGVYLGGEGIPCQRGL